jgi:hypothetical protein
MMTKEREKTYEQLVPRMSEQEKRDFPASYTLAGDCDCCNLMKTDFHVPKEDLNITRMPLDKD